MNAVRAWMFVAVAGAVAVPARACAQAASGDPGAGASSGDFGGGAGDSRGGGAGRHRGGGRHQQASSGGPAIPISLPKPVPEPRQRLDVGALLCETEAELRQHQAAIMARIAGKDAPEPVGCRVVGAMVAVSVLGQDGPARTQVQLRGKPAPAGQAPAGQAPVGQAQVGWTDAVVRDAQVSGP